MGEEGIVPSMLRSGMCDGGRDAVRGDENPLLSMLTSDFTHKSSDQE